MECLADLALGFWAVSGGCVEFPLRTQDGVWSACGVLLVGPEDGGFVLRKWSYNFVLVAACLLLTDL